MSKSHCNSGKTLRAIWKKIIDRTDIQHVIITQLGDLLGFPKKQIVNAVVKYVKKLVPTYNLPKRYCLQ